MRKLPWFISLRYQGLLAILVIAMTLLGVLAYSPATTLASHEQKANAELTELDTGECWTGTDEVKGRVH